MNPPEVGSFDIESIPGSLLHRQRAVVRLLSELQDLKRIRSAEFESTFAAHRYRDVLYRLAREFGNSSATTALYEIAIEESLLAVMTTRVGALGPGTLRRLGVSPDGVRAICQAAFDEHSDAWPGAVPARVFDRIAEVTASPTEEAVDEKLDMLVERLCAEPRAGATAAGKSRVLVVPQESQAEHCYLTAVTAVVLAGYFDADPGEVFSVGLLHHLHNAFMPDAGFAGEVLLGPRLDSVMGAARDQAMELLPPSLRELAAESVTAMTHLETPVARAVNAADAIDRVLQTRFHEQLATFDAERVQRDLELVHEGPLQAFQNGVLRALGVGG